RDKAVLFFFSSRRRHTRFSRDWSSDVCSSDLVRRIIKVEGPVVGGYVHSNNKIASVVALTAGNEELARDIAMHVAAVNPRIGKRSEERRVGKGRRAELWSGRYIEEMSDRSKEN